MERCWRDEDGGEIELLLLYGWRRIVEQ